MLRPLSPRGTLRHLSKSPPQVLPRRSNPRRLTFRLLLPPRLVLRPRNPEEGRTAQSPVGVGAGKDKDKDKGKVDSSDRPHNRKAVDRLRAVVVELLAPLVKSW